jgi:hypothetical protein
MMMSKWVALLLPSLAQSLASSRGHAITDSSEENDGLCDAKALYKARQVGNDWKALKGNPCVSEQVYNELESGERDPRDNSEFLGDDDMAELVDVDVSPRPVKISKKQGDCPTMFPKVQFLGLPHSGSTTLANQMRMHPQLSYGLTKEHNMVFNLGQTSNANLKKAYLSKFQLRNTSDINDIGAKYTFDASPDTIFIGCPDDTRMKEFAIGKKYGTGERAVKAVQRFLGSDTKYIVMLRDPVDWQMSDAEGSRNMELKHMLGNPGDNESKPGLDAARSCYADCIESWLKVMGKNRILFLESGSYFKDPQTSLNKIFKFIGVDHKTYTNQDLGINSGRRRASKEEARFSSSDRKLYWQDSHVKECKSRLQKLTGRGWPWGP